MTIPYKPDPAFHNTAWPMDILHALSTKVDQLAARVEKLEKHHHYIPGATTTSPMIHRETYDDAP